VRKGAMSYEYRMVPDMGWVKSLRSELAKLKVG